MERTNRRGGMWQVGVTRLALFGPLPPPLCIWASAGYPEYPLSGLLNSAPRKWIQFSLFLFVVIGTSMKNTKTRHIWRSVIHSVPMRWHIVGVRPISASAFLPFIDRNLLEPHNKVTQLKGNPSLLVTPEVNLQFDFSPKMIRMMIHRSLSHFTVSPQYRTNFRLKVLLQTCKTNNWPP